jgi:uncharacterized membrane protein
MSSKSKDKIENPWALLIPIGILVIVYLALRVVWLLIPIVILILVFLGGVSEERKIMTKRRRTELSRTTDSSAITSGHMPEKKHVQDRPIYDRKKQKEQGLALGTLIPIAIIGWLWLSSGLAWPFAIPLFVLVVVFLSNIVEHFKGQSGVRDELERSKATTIPEIASRVGVPEERVRRHIVREKRDGDSDVWFDPATGITTSTPVRAEETTTVRGVGCLYCGFALKPEDRFCPFCAAPIRAI